MAPSQHDRTKLVYRDVKPQSKQNKTKNVSILVANVYVYNLEECLSRDSLLPCYKKLKSGTFFKRLEAASIEFEFYKIHC